MGLTRVIQGSNNYFGISSLSDVLSLLVLAFLSYKNALLWRFNATMATSPFMFTLSKVLICSNDTSNRRSYTFEYVMKNVFKIIKSLQKAFIIGLIILSHPYIDQKLCLYYKILLFQNCFHLNREQG